jgi:hypothetical protein
VHDDAGLAFYQLANTVHVTFGSDKRVDMLDGADAWILHGYGFGHGRQGFTGGI